MSWDRLCRNARGPTRTPARLEHTSPRSGSEQPDPRCPWTDTTVLRSPYQRLPRSHPDRSAASKHFGPDRSPGTRDGRAPHSTGTQFYSPGSPFPEPEDESLRHHGTACTHAAHGRTTVSWGRLPRAARNRTPNTARLARTSARTRAKGLGTAGPTLPVDGHTGPAIAIPETPVV